MNPYMTITDIKAAIYARVSSTGDRQSTERQVIDLTDYANRNAMTICKTFEEHISGAKKNHLNVYFQKEGISIYGSDGKENPYLTIMIAVLGTCAQMERESIHYRLQSGRKVYVDKNLATTGKSGLGRKEGYRKPTETKKEEYKEVLKLLRGGYAIRKVAKLTNVSESTVKRLKKEFAI